MWFKSDNSGPAHPDVLAALVRANEGYAGSYGDDPWMEEARTRIRDLFEAPQAAVHLVSTGTAANALALATLCPPWATIYCHDTAHIEVDECGAPEFYTGGAKLTLVPGAQGRIDPEALSDTLARAAHVGVHNVQRGALSITQATEAGTIYTPDQISALCQLARAYHLPTHLDGARFANALVRLGCSPAEMTWKAGIDAVSFGGTKNGLIAAEAVILFDPAKSWEFELRRKRGGHLFSKHRLLSAQMAAYLEDGLWLDMARAANDMTDRLAAGLRQLPDVRQTEPVEANMMFPRLPAARHRAALAAGAQYYTMDTHTDPLIRLVTNWSTSADDVDGLVSALAAA